MGKYAHEDHLKQGPWGSWKTRKRGSHTSQGVEGGAKRGSSGSKFDQPPSVTTRKSGSHLDNSKNVAGSDKTAVRGGGGRHGHDRTNPSAGKRKSGSKNQQHPNVRKR